MKKRLKEILSGITKALLITLVLVFVLLSTNKDFGIFGFHFYHVVTRSMDSVIPVGSLVIVKEGRPEDINVGDDITFYVSDNTSKTHRVVKFEDNYNGSKQRGFTTKGVDNPSNDEDIVLAGNVVGKVIHHVEDLGLILDYLVNRVWLIVFLIVLLNLGWYCIKKIILENGEENEIKKSKIE